MTIYTYKSAKKLCDILCVEYIEVPSISDQLIDEGADLTVKWGFAPGHTFNKGVKRPQSEEEREKRKVMMMGNKFGVGKSGSRGKRWTLSEESKQKHRLSLLGTTQKQVQCPYCITSGGVSNMKRYHFNNCKNAHNPS
jgi:hypothetical protein